MSILSDFLGFGRDLLVVSAKVEGLSEATTDLQHQLRELDRRMMKYEIVMDIVQQRLIGRDQHDD